MKIMKMFHMKNGTEDLAGNIHDAKLYFLGDFSFTVPYHFLVA